MFFCKKIIILTQISSLNDNINDNDNYLIHADNADYLQKPAEPLFDMQKDVKEHVLGVSLMPNLCLVILIIVLFLKCLL